jgi:hypothetical protein
VAASVVRTAPAMPRPAAGCRTAVPTSPGRDTVISTLRRAGRVAAGMLPVAMLARLGVPALAAVVFLAILALGAACWVIASCDRSDRVTRMIYARHGDARSLVPGSPATPARASHRRPARGR